ncbi:MAG: hypothetical protein M3Y74_12170, partial [Chloroflexota bacterium]|nr:hypothetical protein [Chloroflexota bacterium]
ASMLLIPVSARRHLNDLSDDMVTKIGIVYYADARDALLKALVGHAAIDAAFPETRSRLFSRWIIPALFVA